MSCPKEKNICGARNSIVKTKVWTINTLIESKCSPLRSRTHVQRAGHSSCVNSKWAKNKFWKEEKLLHVTLFSAKVSIFFILIFTSHWTKRRFHFWPYIHMYTFRSHPHHYYRHHRHQRHHHHHHHPAHSLNFYIFFKKIQNYNRIYTNVN